MRPTDTRPPTQQATPTPPDPRGERAWCMYLPTPVSFGTSRMISMLREGEHQIAALWLRPNGSVLVERTQGLAPGVVTAAGFVLLGEKPGNQA